MSLFTTTEGIVTPVQPFATSERIVCGDCGGDDFFPHETYLTRDGRCSECGGRSYVSANLIHFAIVGLAKKIKLIGDKKDGSNTTVNQSIN